ncbi:hypothetical protein LZC95_25780 [Pendulispora brunnea]|uniref:Uncharacterized protein n=1 Tax=Pendulispora brunnea TaxID=2905690 RepID=A0ABZ2JXT1_9BACT
MNLLSVSAFARQYDCDNDRDPNMYNCYNSIDGSYAYRSGQRGDWNRDDRLGTSGSYWWVFSGVGGDSADFYAWLANAAFTDTRAEYSANSDRMLTINQNTAPSGWSYVGSNSRPGGVQVSHGSGRTGADLIRVLANDGLTDDDEANQTSSCGQVAPLAPEVAIIQQNMLNAVDRYRDVKGAFHVFFSNNGQDDRVEFKISEQDQRSFVRTTPRGGNAVEETSSAVSSLVLYPERAMFRRSAHTPISHAPSARHFFNKACESVYVRRQDPAWAHAANEITLPSNYAFWLTDSDAKVVGQETLLSRKVTVVAGRHDWYLGTKLGASAFKMWIDDETGVLLKLSGTDDRGRVVYAIDVTDIQFDRGVGLGEFSLEEPVGWANIGLQ